MVEKYITPTSLARGFSPYGSALNTRERALPGPIGTYGHLAHTVRHFGIELDGSDQSIRALDRGLSEGQIPLEPQPLYELAIYVGDTLCSRSGFWVWVRDAADYVRLRHSVTEFWDVLEFIHRRAEGKTSASIEEALAEMARRFDPEIPERTASDPYL
ncbi:hypothetical protein [Curtobacterium ammoniigenes]|uniref:hypothetical protein n=1 Tax=Curtobacterium ammoniigenes TaxID=395387 RepID=UPI000AF3CE25|nr:hypothetical protein [Curtobacterium ammoniigenes]